MGAIILFDGECNFCNESVQFIIKRDPKSYFHFASLQGKTGERLLKEHNIKKDIDSIVLIEGNNYYLKSTAALRICLKLKYPWKFFAILLVVPQSFRDLFYEVVAKHRYKWFGKKQSCLLPSPEVRQRFLD